MTVPAAVRTDWHSHSSRTDGADDAERMADAAQRAGLGVWGLSDHVRADSTWLDDYVTVTRALRRDGLTIHCGVEAKLLDTSGRLDLPPGLPALDYVLVADHQFPSATGPQSPRTVAADLAARRRRPADVVDDLIAATTAGLARCPCPPIVAHLFSLLPKLGLSERDDVRADHLHALAAACLDTGAAVEINEKWRCPSPEVVIALATAGVPLVAGSDAHCSDEVGRHDYLTEVLAATGVPLAEGPPDLTSAGTETRGHGRP